MKWGNVNITHKEVVDDMIRLVGLVDITDKDYKNTKKLTWIP